MSKRSTMIDLNGFLSWAFNDLITNTTRGVLAEYIVAQALGISSKNRVEWDAYDLVYKDIKIEVKSTAYIQAWNDHRYATPRFGIGMKKAWYADTNTVGELMRHADLYIFCVLAHKDRATINPLDTNQWEFYIVKTKDLDRMIPNQKNISLSSLIKTFNLEVVDYLNIKPKVDAIISIT